MFYGRNYELQQLEELLVKRTATLITIKGRRRIGKSTLIKEFAKKNQIDLFEFQGLPPRPGIKMEDQLENFSKTISKHTGLPQMHLTDWQQAFQQLNLYKTTKKKFIIFLDEISWMSLEDPDFAGKLKIIWDSLLKDKSKLMLILCGSVSSWIEKNISKNSGYVGRISSDFTLKELPLYHSKQILSHHHKLSDEDTLKYLSIVGGVPRYLEEINSKETPENNIKRLCFNPNQFLYLEFDLIFSDIFGKRSEFYKKIMLALHGSRLTPLELANKVKLPLNGDFMEYLDNLRMGGFIERDYSWSFKDGEELKLSQLRISDNYSRFYLHYIHPRKSKIEKFPMKHGDSLDFLNWHSLIGLQFENLILNNLSAIADLLNIPRGEIIQAGPFFQSATKAKKGVQIDLLFQTKFKTLYLCEVKAQQKITASIIDDIQNKIKSLKRPRNMSIRPCLIYSGELSSSIEESDFFYKIISFEKLLVATAE